MRAAAMLSMLMAFAIASGSESPPIDMPPGIFVSDMPRGIGDTIHMLTAAVAGPDEGITIVGPKQCEVGQLVRLSVTGLPPIDASKTLDEALAWLKTLKLQMDQPPEAKSPVAMDLTIRLAASPSLSWRLDLEFTPPEAGDYVLACDWNEAPNQLVLYRVRAGAGPHPPPPPPPPAQPILQVAPETPLSAAGPAGGPFTPPAATYTVANAGGGILTWHAETMADFLSVSPASGALAAGQSQSMTIAFSDRAKTLSAGTHVGIVFLRNTTNGQGDTLRLAVLTVSGPPPPPPIRELWGIVIEESRNRTAKQAVVLMSQEVRAAFKSGHFRVIDKDAAQSGTAKAWIDKAAGKPLPYLFLSGETSGSIVWEGPMPETIPGMLELVRKYQPKQAEAKTVEPGRLQGSFRSEMGRTAVPVFTLPQCGPQGCPTLVY